MELVAGGVFECACGALFYPPHAHNAGYSAATVFYLADRKLTEHHHKVRANIPRGPKFYVRAESFVGLNAERALARAKPLPDETVLNSVDSPLPKAPRHGV